MLRKPAPRCSWLWLTYRASFCAKALKRYMHKTQTSVIKLWFFTAGDWRHKGTQSVFAVTSSHMIKLLRPALQYTLVYSNAPSRHWGTIYSWGNHSGSPRLFYLLRFMHSHLPHASSVDCSGFYLSGVFSTFLLHPGHVCSAAQKPCGFLSV